MSLFRIVLLACLSGAILSCGPVQYSHHVLRANAAIAEAETAEAPEEAPYEYWYADAHLKQARREVGYSDFQEAVKCARIANEYATKAVEISNRRRRERGR